jgi:phosphoribosylglycinamide formyltransferase 1
MAPLHCRPMKRIVILISGRGSNMQAIVQACAHEQWQAEVAAVISNRPDAQGLRFAQQHGIATRVVDHSAFDSRDSFDAELAKTIDNFTPDLVALAGFMRILTPAFVHRYQGRIVNVHPSLLPAFSGLHTHQRAIDGGCKLTGATVHYVSTELDHGPIIAQAVVPILPDDTEASLAARVLEREHLMYPRAIRWLLEGKLRTEAGRVIHTAGEPQLWLSPDWIPCIPTL